MFNCTTSYFEHESNFSKPMPWIGLYIAAASLCCAILVLMDRVSAYRRSQMWTPSRFFALNASSLTVLAVATKLSVDLNTSMPRGTDQLAKVSTSVLLCVSIAYFIPSLGKMGDTEMIANLIALLILVITSIVNLIIQLTTGVIYTFIATHISLLASMIYLLMVCCCTAIALASIKNDLRGMYERMLQVATDELTNENGAAMTIKPLEEYLVKFSIMSRTGSPHFVLGRSVLCSSSTYISCLDIFNSIGLLYSYARHRFAIFCNDESDYKWSILLVLFAQVFTIIVGFSVLCQKLLIILSLGEFRILQMRNIKIKVERYWIQLLIEIRQRPFFFYIHNKRCRKLVHHAKRIFCNTLISIQIAMVYTIKILGSCFSVTLGCLLRVAQWIIFQYINSNDLHSHATSLSITNPTELEQYVLYLKGEERIIESMLRSALLVTSKYIEEGKREEPTCLIEFLRSHGSRGFLGVFLFQSNRVPHFDIEEPPPNCWSLSVVTLTSLAILLPNIDSRKVNNLLQAVREGLVIVKKIEENLNDYIRFKNKRKAADSVWEEVDVHDRRFDIEVKDHALRENNPINFLRCLADSAKNNFQKFEPSKDNTSIWPIEAVASYSLYSECETILLHCQHGSNQFQTADDLFEILSTKICDILGACFTNLKNSILTQCSRSTIENMNETARSVLILFGRTEKIMELLNGRETPNLNPDKLAFIDEWQHSLGI